MRAERSDRSLTRRALLQRAGAAGAAAALSSAYPGWLDRAAAATDARVVIVGGGAAGLTAAYRLKQAGCIASAA